MMPEIRKISALAVLAGSLFAILPGSGCATYDRRGLDPLVAAQIEATKVRREFRPSSEMRRQILALIPDQVSDQDVRQVLGQCPAPRIINIHGGIYPVHRKMISFSEFLIGMGYPGASITNPGDGTYTFSCYESSKMIAGVIAWYYEREGLRPMLVGHSQGGMQVVKVLRKLDGPPTARLHVWNPLTWKEEPACDYVDPLTGGRRPVVGLTLPFASATAAGGVTRLLPNQWDMLTKLRSVPDSVEEFSGFYKGMDLLGGDFLGYGPANHYYAKDRAAVRNIRLPSAYVHRSIPDTRHLLDSEAIKEWIDKYQPLNEHVSTPTVETKFDSESRNILWAADIWFSIKKHWVLELQRYLRAKPASQACR
jgi:pimeloyl-ACP methyl ester carboxylesterase